MELETVVRCCECHQPIISGEGFIRFKVPGEKKYKLFHCRFRVRDCWEEYLMEGKKVEV